MSCNKLLIQVYSISIVKCLILHTLSIICCNILGFLNFNFNVCSLVGTASSFLKLLETLNLFQGVS